MRARIALYSLIVAASIATLYFNRLSIFVTLLVVIALASLSRFESKSKVRWKWAFIISLVLCIIGMARFILLDAFTGIAGARSLATNKKAVSMLREIYFAQETFKRKKLIPVKGAEKGAPALLSELASTQSSRVKIPLKVPLLAPRFSPRIITDTGPAAASEGYLFLICLPDEKGAFSATPSSKFLIDKSSGRWGAYAWPGGIQTPSKGAYFINDKEEILAVKESADLADSKHPEDYQFLGPDRAPDCASAMQETREEFWVPWRGKKPKSK